MNPDDLYPESGPSPADVSRPQRIKSIGAMLGVDIERFSDFSRPLDTDRKIEVSCPRLSLPYTTEITPIEEVRIIDELKDENDDDKIKEDPETMEVDQDPKTEEPPKIVVDPRIVDSSEPKSLPPPISQPSPLPNNLPVPANTPTLATSSTASETVNAPTQIQTLNEEGGEKKSTLNWRRIYSFPAKDSADAVNLEFVLDPNDIPWIWIRRGFTNPFGTKLMDLMKFTPEEAAFILNQSDCFASIRHTIAYEKNGRKIQVKPSCLDDRDPTWIGCVIFRVDGEAFLVSSLVPKRWSKNKIAMEILAMTAVPLTYRAKQMLTLQLGSWIAAYHLGKMLQTLYKNMAGYPIGMEEIYDTMDRLKIDDLATDFSTIIKFIPALEDAKINFSDIIENHVYNIVGEGNEEAYDLRVKHFVYEFLEYKFTKGWPLTTVDH